MSHHTPGICIKVFYLFQLTHLKFTQIQDLNLDTLIISPSHILMLILNVQRSMDTFIKDGAHMDHLQVFYVYKK